MVSDDKMRETAKDAAEKGYAEARGAMDDARSKASQAAGQASGTADDLLGRARDSVQNLSDRLPNSASDAYRAGQQAYAQGSDRVIRQVTKQPVEALLLAGALGYLVGWATSRS